MLFAAYSGSIAVTYTFHMKHDGQDQSASYVNLYMAIFECEISKGLVTMSKLKDRLPNTCGEGLVQKRLVQLDLVYNADGSHRLRGY